MTLKENWEIIIPGTKGSKRRLSGCWMDYLLWCFAIHLNQMIKSL